MRARIPRNVFSAIESRRYGPYSRSMRNTYRYNNRLMSNLVASPNWFFKKMLRIRSSKSAGFECHDKLYSENNRKCFALRGHKGSPTLLYTIDPSLYPGKWRYEAQVTVTRSGMSNPNPPRCDLRLLLTSQSLLEVREENTGRIMETIDLNSPDSPDVKFHALHWDPTLHQVIAMSSRPKSTDKSDVLCHIIVLEICPRVRKALRIAIRRKVFGQKLYKVMLSEGILHVIHRDEVVKLYDFSKICKTNRTVEGVHDKLLLITDPGKPFYEVKNSNELFTLGGHPWHYIACSSHSHEYTVRTIDHEVLASFPTHEPNSVTFHADDSGIISHFKKEGITNYKMVRDERTGKASLMKIKEVKLINSKRIKDGEASEPMLHHKYAIPPTRRSQRIIDLPALPLIDEEERTLVSDDFENELNLHLLVGLDRGDPRKRGVIQFLDNETGTLIKTMKFKRTLAVRTEYFVTMDLDVLIVFATQDNGTSCEADVYRLQHSEAWLDRCPTEPYGLPGGHSQLHRGPDRDPDYVP